MSSNECNLAAQQARIAIVQAEKAFFDPNMVALLCIIYLLILDFPAEHLLAIYLPFFLPIAVPMLSVLAKEFKIWRTARSSKLKLE